MHPTLRLRHPYHLRPSAALPAAAAIACVLLSGCSGMSDSMPSLAGGPRFDPDDFESVSIHTRHINAPKAQACEAARRALLSQGYLVNTATDELVAGRKYFQPSVDTHYEVEMRVVCAPEGPEGQRTAAFASALQDRYVIKKINNSASLGVGALGSLSLPVSASDDTLVKVGSETVNDKRFYERFFELFGRFVQPPPAPAPESATPMLVRPQPQLQERSLPAAQPVQPAQPAGPVSAADPAAAAPAAAPPASPATASGTADMPLPALATPAWPADSAATSPAAATARP